MTMLNVDFNDLAKRAVHTFLQSFFAALAVAYAAAGLDVSQIVDVDSAKKFALAVVTAAIAAALSAAKTTVAGLTTASSKVGDSDMGAGTLNAHLPEHAAEEDE